MVAAAFAPRDASIGLGCLVFFILWHGFRAIGQIASVTIWSFLGVAVFCWSFTVAGRLKPREPVDDNVRRDAL